MEEENKINGILFSLVKITLGCFLMGIATANFLLPCKLSSGGFAGISTVIYYVFQIPVGTTILILNIPLFILSYFRLGKKLALKSIYGTLVLSAFINFLENKWIFTQDKLLSSIYGGICMGIGSAIILKENASTGGSDLLTYIIRSFFPTFRSGTLLVIIDAVIILASSIILQEIEIGLYSFVVIYLVGKMIDIIFEGVYFTKMVYIISPEYEKIAKEIGRWLERGSTGIYAKGMYEKKDSMMLLCVAGRSEVEKIKKIVFRRDPRAFLVISSVREVRGKGFKKLE